MGSVLLYTSRERDIEPMSVTHDISQPLPSVLKKLGLLYLPIKSRFYFIIASFNLMSLTETNSHIFVKEHDTWAMKGRFNKALGLTESLPWKQDKSGRFFVSLLAVRIFSSSLIYPTHQDLGS